jgi:hypothetical protein
MIEAGCVRREDLPGLQQHFEYFLARRDQALRESGAEFQATWWAYARTGLLTFKLELAISDTTVSLLLRQRNCMLAV